GMRLRRVVLLFYVLSVIAGIVGILAAIHLRGREALLLHSLLFLAAWVIFYKLGVIREEPGGGQGAAAGGDFPHVPRPASAIQDKSRRGAPPSVNFLFTSVGRRVSLLQEFRRAAEEMGVHLEIHAVDCQAMAPALQTADKAAIVPPVDSGAYVGSLLAYCRSHAIHAVFPLIDTELRVLAEAADRFAAIGTRAVISTPEVIRIASDKVQTKEFLVAHRFLTPRILGPEELKSPTFPLFMKPKGGSSSLGARKVTTPEQWEYYRRTCPDDVVQEFIEGVEYTVDVFADFDGSPLCAVPRRRHEVRAGEVSKSQTVRNRRIMEESCRLVRELGGCRGMVTIQCFLTRDDRIVFIEINPRFGGGVPLSIRAGADSPKWVLELLLGRRPSATMDAWTDQLFMLRYDEGIFVLPGDLPRP
ncbi:MAG TPA: ATP-grasp domain-containing protein, partial [Phycisphaerae bacterium]|nr:ATP-grasp domain-containing protein [Phycisphaerae bacterium]